MLNFYHENHEDVGKGQGKRKIGKFDWESFDLWAMWRALAIEVQITEKKLCSDRFIKSSHKLLLSHPKKEILLAQ